MKDNDYSKFIKKVLTETSKIANKNFQKNCKSITKKEDNNQVLTKTDLKIGQYIIKEISKYYPNFNIIDEEAGVIDKNSDFTWVIDPIDGTSNFASGVPTYGTIIGLLNKNTPIAGGISLPFFNEILTAQKNHGTFCNGKKIYVTKETKLLSSLVAFTTDSHRENPKFTFDEHQILAKITLETRNMRNSGSTFDCVTVAKGKYGAYLNQTSKIWDNIGQHIIIEEAGGLYTDFFGKPMDYSNPLSKANKNFTYCCGAPQIHSQLQKIIR